MAPVSPRAVSLLVVVAALGGVLCAQDASDWPQWRGPRRDGVVAAFSEPREWPDALQRRWRVDVGIGYATPLLVGDRLFVFARQGEDEVMLAIAAGSGSLLWRAGYPAPVTINLRSGSARHGEGPKSTPTFADGRLFSMGMGGIVSAFDAQTGKIIWQKPAPQILPLYGTATSPIVEKDTVIVHVGGHDSGALTAFDVATGGVRWRWDGDGPAYASPIIANLQGVRQLVGLSQKHIIGVDVSTGMLLWQRPFLPPNTTSSVTPIVYGDTVIVSGQSMGITAFTVNRRGAEWGTETSWENETVSLYMSNAVIAGDVLFGLSHKNSGQFFSLDARTGKTLWTTTGRDATNGAIVRAGDLLFVLKDDAELIVVRPSRTGLEPLHRYTVADSATWAQPVISGHRVFIKDESSLALWTLD